MVKHWQLSFWWLIQRELEAGTCTPLQLNFLYVIGNPAHVNQQACT